MKLFPRLLALSALLLFSAGLAARARVVYVNANAPGPVHDGASWATAYLTVTEGIPASAGDEVWLARGVYYANISPGANVALYGGFAGTETAREQRDWKANPTILDGGGVELPVVSCYADGAGVDGFTIRNGVFGVYVSSPGTAAPVIITHNAIGRNRTAGVQVHAGGAMLTGNTVSDNRGYGVMVDGAGSAELRNNTISGNGFDGVHLFWDAQATLVNNTFCANVGDGLHVDSYIHGGVSNNIFAYNGQFGVTTYGGAIPSFTGNNAWRNGYGAIRGEYDGIEPEAASGNFVADPRLSSLFHDVHLQPGSPCIDAGDAAAAAGPNDIDGQPRVQDAHVDIGSDESDGSLWAVPSIAWRVSPTGSDQADGRTWGTAKRTVGAALLEAQGGDEVWVAGGVYAELIKPVAGVALYGGFAGTESQRGQRDWVSHPTVLDGGISPGNVVECRGLDTVVDGFQIRNGGYGVTVYGKATIANNRFTGSSIYGVSVTGAATIARNTFHWCANGVYVEAEYIYGARFFGGAVSLEGNTIRNTGNGAYICGSATLIGNTISSNETGVAGGGLTLVNNTVTGNITGVDLQGMASLTNNIVAFNSGTGVSFREGETWDFSHNDVYGNATNFQGCSAPEGQGNLSLDPRLSNPYGGVHIQPNSPCRDAGVDTDRAGWTDIDGEPRIQGAHLDIGSDESDGTAWDSTPVIWHISPGGDDARDGRTWATARRTISAAMESARGFDEVWVSEGTYRESIALPTAVSLYGGFAGAETDRGQRDTAAHPTVLDGGGARRAVTCQFPAVALDGLSVRNAETGVYVAAGAALANLAITGNRTGAEITGPSSITDSTLTDNGIGARITGPASITNSTLKDNEIGAEITGPSSILDTLIVSNATGLIVRAPLTLQRCSVAANREAGVNAAHGGMADARGNAFTANPQYGALGTQTGYLFLASNTFSGNGVGVSATESSTAVLSSNVFSGNGTGALLNSRNEAALANNTVVGNTAHGVRVDSARASLTNNLVAFNEGDGVSTAGDGALIPSFSRNDVFGNKAGDISGFTPPDGQGNLALDPVLVDRANGDFRLQAGSPCIDAGDDTAVEWGAADADGKPRILGVHVDIGAYERGDPGALLADIVLALKIAAGLTPATAADAARLDVEPSTPGIDLLDAVRLIRTFGT